MKLAFALETVKMATLSSDDAMAAAEKQLKQGKKALAGKAGKDAKKAVESFKLGLECKVNSVSMTEQLRSGLEEAEKALS
eukprot:COSAG02_NODE_34560_length_482_cov_0.804178_1_plen_79_part_01